jgi:arylsulfatase A-like enzyme
MGKKAIVCGSAAALLVLAASCRKSAPNRTELARGGDIHLLDTLSEANVGRSPLRISLRAVTRERLDADWTKTADLPDGRAVWGIRTASPIVEPPGDSGSKTMVYRQAKALRHRSDLFRKAGRPGEWNAQGNRIWVSAARGEDPNREKYLVDYETLQPLDSLPLRREELKDPILCGLDAGGPAPRRILAYPLSDPVWVRSAQDLGRRIIVRQDGSELAARPDVLEALEKPPGARMIYPPRPGKKGGIFTLGQASDRLKRRLRSAPGPYILRIMARASLAGSESPLLALRLDGEEIARQPVDSEQWTPLYFRMVLKDSSANLSAQLGNDYCDPDTGRDRNIYISRVDLWPEANLPDKRKSSDGDSGPVATWSCVDDSEEVLYQATPLGMLRMFTGKDRFSTRRWLPAGIAFLQVTARADLAGEEYPRLAVCVDEVEMGGLEVTGTEDRGYASGVFPVTGGWHDIDIVFENDYYDPQTRRDRNIYLTRISLARKSAVFVAQPLDGSQARYSISYPSLAPWLTELRLYREFGAKGGNLLKRVSGPVDLHRVLRQALICPSRTEFIFEVRVPGKGKFGFGYGARSSGRVPPPGDHERCATRLTIKALEGGRAARALFSWEVAESDLRTPAPWKEAEVDLTALAGRNVRLVIETQALGVDGGNSPVVFLAEPVITSGSAPPRRQPNIILITADALRADHLSCYGYGRETSPNLDILAGESVLFEDAVASASWTLPAVASLLTSLYPSFHGANIWDATLGMSQATLPAVLHRDGYVTSACVNNPYLYPSYGLSEGFDFYDYGHSSEGQLQSAFKRIEALKERKFFLYIHFLPPHAPYRAPRPFCETFGDPDHPRFDTTIRTINGINSRKQLLSPADRDYFVSQYDGSILYLDDVLKRLFDRLKQLGLYRDSLIVFHSDHGEQFQEHGSLGHGKTLFQGEIRVPLIMKLPSGRVPGPLRIRGLVQSVDIAPTILGTVKLAPPPSFLGKDLSPLLRGEPPGERPAFAELHTRRMLAIIKGGYKFISPYPGTTAGGGAAQGEEVLDLSRDPGEIHDFRAGRPDLVKDFEKEREAFLAFAARYRKDLGLAKAANRVALDASQSEKLRALGYIR